MEALSLQEVMNAVSKRLDAVRPEDAPPPPDVMSELDAFAALDPLLGDLQKQYLDLRLSRKKQEKQFGKDSPMAEIAQDAEDSAWCMAQTRYIELRADRQLMKRVQTMLHEHRAYLDKVAEEKAKAAARNQAEALNLFYEAQQSLARKNAFKSKLIFPWIWLFIYIDSMKKQAAQCPPHARLKAA